MTKQEKINRKIRRCQKRRKARQASLAYVLEAMKEGRISFSKAKQYVRYGSFYQDGEYLQVCELGGTCSYPCTGDC